MRAVRGLPAVLCLLALLVCAPARAQKAPAGGIAELRPFRSGAALCAFVRARDLLDERTRSTVESGLPGTSIFHLRLEDRAGRPVAEHFFERTLRFDLWNDRYLLEEGGRSFSFAGSEAADSALSSLRACEICPFSRLRPDAEYRLVVRIAVRPLAPEDRQRLSRYVSRSSAGGVEEVAFDLSAVFGRALGDKDSARRIIEHAGLFFRPGDVKEEP